MKWNRIAALMLLIGAASMIGCSAGGPRDYGKAVTLEEVTSISDILNDPEAYHDKVVRVEGKVTEVCQQMGCWFKIADGSQQIMIDLEMRPDSYTIPKRSKGKQTVVQGRVQYDESAPIRIVGIGNTLE